jgi:hypothetical protein
MLLQAGASFWLFLVEILQYGKYYILEYDISLIEKWKNYSKPRQLMKLETISMSYKLYNYFHDPKRWSEWDKKYIIKNKEQIVRCIDNNDYNVEEDLTHETQMLKKGDGYAEIKKSIPIFKACGISQCVDPEDIYWAIDEYFALEKSSAERASSVDITDKEKIINHGFDTKTSFRGKRKGE